MPDRRTAGRGAALSARLPTRARLVLAVVLAVVVTLPGCAAIPSSGPVRAEGEREAGPADSFVRVLAPPPRPGAGPAELVEDFLLAASALRTSPESTYDQAREYLTPAARLRWRPEAEVVVYDPRAAPETVSGGPTPTVLMRVRQVAEIDASGRWSRLVRPRAVTARFTLAQQDGQWRVDRLDDGVLLSVAEVERDYRSLDLYFLDPDQDVVVPDPVLVPQRPGLATVLVSRLLRGPSRWLEGAVSTAFPAGTELAGGSVRVQDGVAQVDLTAAAAGADPKARQDLSAQLVWTLRQLPDVRAVRVTVEGAPLDVASAPEEQPRTSWPQFDPSALPDDAAVPYVVRDGRVARLGGSPGYLSGPAGSGRPQLRRPAVSIEGSAVAALSADRTTLSAWTLVDRRWEQTLRARGHAFGPPSWDRRGTLWVYDTGGGDTAGVLQAAPQGRHLAPVALPDLGGRVSALRVSRDGSRVAVATRDDDRSVLQVGAVVRASAGGAPSRVTGLRPVFGTSARLGEVAWVDSRRLAVLTRDARGQVRPLVTSVDGYESMRLTAVQGASTLTAAPGERPLLVGTSGGQVLQPDGRRWVVAGSGSDPVYPG